MKIKYCHIAFFLIILITVTACNSNDGNGNKSDSYLTPEQVLNVFKQEGVKLTKSDKEAPNHLIINEVQPLIYQSTALNNQYLLVYNFDSLAKAEECNNHFRKNKMQFQNLDLVSPYFFKVKNIVIALAMGK